MSKSKPQWFKSPFGHVRYALALSKKHMKQLGVSSKSFLATEGFGQVTIFALPDYTDVVVQIGNWGNRTIHEINAVIVHESVHVWQEIRDRMVESNPSSEFEAYSIQMIALDLMAQYEELSKNGCN